VDKKPYKRTKLGRELTYKRSYNLYKKSKMMAYIWWLFAAGFGAHRFYLGDKKIAGTLLFATSILVVTMNDAPFISDFATWIFGFYILILFVEGVYIPFLVNRKNRELDLRLKQEFELA